MSCRTLRLRPVLSVMGSVGLATILLADAPASWTDDLSPIAPVDWTYARAAHLIERAGFGATPEQIAELAALTPQQAGRLPTSVVWQLSG